MLVSSDLRHASVPFKRTQERAHRITRLADDGQHTEVELFGSQVDEKRLMRGCDKVVPSELSAVLTRILGLRVR